MADPQPVSNTSVAGFTNFNRYYFAQNSKQDAVIDERFNGGGWIADYIVILAEPAVAHGRHDSRRKRQPHPASHFWTQGHVN
jgi:hypothetical protein